ncbi:RNAse P Rpr2/Rpp21/SNM1 subunit domain-containing protein [Chytriomyces cf. hyalinus JEL632]|nr:RNAse P Rpr2/Rpp21/SNM1 subunit domain-containing protein [Chytriomyces cf. hyalinus JEL632]
MAKDHKKQFKQSSKHRSKQVTGADALVRMNYLYQASSLFSQGASPSLSRFYAQSMKTVAARMVLRMDPQIKRTICKGCCSLLIPGMNAHVETKDSNTGVPHVVTTTCTLCSRTKNLPVTSSHTLFIERAGVVVVSKEETSEDTSLKT